MNAYVFPGQGSQKKGMGQGLFDDFPEITKQVDDILGYSITELCLSDPDQKLNLTQYTQPAMYTVNALTYLKKIQSTGKKPDFLAGHSLGEYNALHAAEVMSFETGLRLVKKRGELMSKATKGAMAAIINSSEKQIREILDAADLTTIDIANYNAPTQIIISGLKDDISKSQSYFEKANARFFPLNTSGAFHSRYMKDAAAEFGEYIRNFEFSKPCIPVIANVTAKPYEYEHIAENLIDQIFNPVRWTDSVQYLLNRGVIEFEETGTGDVLTKLISYIRKDWAPNSTTVKDLQESKSESANPALKPSASFTADAEIAPEKITAESKDQSLSAQEMVQHWNKTYPVGTKVISDLYDDKELETRTEAVVLFGHRAAVYMKGYNGYFDLREIRPVN